jgi:Flp pilus assembly protein TadG
MRFGSGVVCRLRDHSGVAVAEFAVVLPLLVALAAAAFNAVALAATQVRMQSVAATTARVVARGDDLSQPLRRQLDATGDMTVTLNGDLVTVRLARTVTFLRMPVAMTASAVAVTEVSTNDFEQD